MKWDWEDKEMVKMQLRLLFIVIVISVVGSGIGWRIGDMLFAQAPAPSKYAPSDDQLHRLQVSYLQAQLAQRDMQIAQQRMQSALGQMAADAEKIKAENKWPANVQFNPDTLSFSEPESHSNVPAGPTKPAPAQTPPKETP
jgi:hypothetical protein